MTKHSHLKTLMPHATHATIGVEHVGDNHTPAQYVELYDGVRLLTVAASGAWRVEIPTFNPHLHGMEHTPADAWALIDSFPEWNDDDRDILPPWATGLAHGRVIPGTILWTRDGRKSGNGFVAEVQTTDLPDYWEKEMGAKVVVYTDMGNRMTLSEREVYSGFHLPQLLADVAECFKSRHIPNPYIDPVEEQVKGLVLGFLPMGDEVDAADTFEEMGLDSLDKEELLLGLEDAFDIEIPTTRDGEVKDIPSTVALGKELKAP